jgi:Short repeat of unknown function (DUF308)
VSILAGIVILMAGFAELFTAFIAPGWRWLHAILAAVFVLTGIVVFFRPSGTFAPLAAFIGAIALTRGITDIVLAFQLHKLTHEPPARELGGVRPGGMAPA